MRILYCNKYNFAFSGTEVYLFDVMELMRTRGHTVALFSMADPRGESTEYDRHFVPHADFKNDSHGVIGGAKLAARAIYSRTARVRLRKMIAEFRPDVAHVRNIYHHLSPSILWELKAQGVPIVYHINDFKLLCPSYNMVSRGHACERCHNAQFWHVLTEGCYAGSSGSKVVLAAEAYFHNWLRTYEKCVTRFLAPSQFVRDKLVENGWPAARIDVLPHFQRLPAEPPENAAADAPILYFGRLSPEKGLPDLVLAMQRLPKVRLRIAGEGVQRPELEKLAETLGLANVEFTGQLAGSALNDAISAARFTVLPSRAYETFGKSILESFAFERPVVASDLGSRRELIRENKTGLLFPPGDVETLAEKISFLCANPELATQMGAAGRELVQKQHSPETHYVALMELYRTLTPSDKQPHPPAAIVRATHSPLRVAFIGGRGVISKYSGIEAYYEEVGKRLVEMGHQVTVYCRTYFTPRLKEHNGMRLVRLPTLRSKHLDTLVHTFLSTVHVLFSGCDIVHYQCLGPALFSFIPRVFGKKTVVSVQGLDWQRKKWAPIASLVLRLGERASVRLPSATMVVSKNLQTHYNSRYRSQVTYVPNGTIIRRRRSASRLAGWGLTAGNYILFLGRFSPEKNCHLLIQAFEKIQTPVKLVLAGGSSHSDVYAGELRNRQSENILCLDWVSGDALDELLTNAMLFVLPSDIEGLSLALLDAMGAGVCVLTSDIAENCELVEGAGFTFKRGDVDDLERMLRWLISDPQARVEAAKRAQERVRKHYLWPVIAKQVELTYFRTMGAQDVRVAFPESPGFAELGAPRPDHADSTGDLGM
ncbi:MAG TPA: glycosyltransferase family 4 protein [Terriglobales bacterium]|nr:glycosyltransferase family 4 protein [Terriglobales bacterium]